MPYGSAKTIVAAMELGEGRTVRPEHVVSMHNAARRMGRRIMAVAFHQDGERMYRIIRIPEGLPFTAHRRARRPRRDELTGRWQPDPV
ncbi:hypothetical protein Oter_3382 [Opitutus terrae PB90-1]|uniref:Uncharacterized protein n=2 Tax=Opitutus terrae TaxID=107709 RepID=B1ZU97_OPITP|nr:hypothetical protein Oter_3382 [Opitutus terrae PB90-1]